MGFQQNSGAQMLLPRAIACLRGMVWGMCFCLLGIPALAADRPNVLMIAVDDLNDWVGCLEGHPQVQTPHIDALARRGTLFLNAHCQAPLCNSSRTSILTGVRPSTSGVYALEPWLRESPMLRTRLTLPECFRQAGYRTLTTGKIFHGGTPPRAERAQYFDQWGPGPSLGPRPAAKLVASPTPNGNHPLVDWGMFPHSDEDKGDWKVATWASEQLRKSGQQPWFLAVGFSLPHVPCYATGRWFDLYPAQTLQLPVVPAHDRDDVPAFAWKLNWKLPEPRLSWLRAQEQWTPLVQAYLACISFVDDQVGRVLKALEESGQADRTIVVLWSDHGWHLGEKGITGKNSLWSESTRVPLIFAGPGIAVGRCGEPAELLDLYPTLAELCDLPAPEQEGHSLLPQLRQAETPRAWPAITTQSPGNHAVVTRQWRYIRYADQSEELYDLHSDPGEWTNLAGDPQFEKIKTELAGWMPQTSAPPARGSRSRLLEQKDGVWYWENEPLIEAELQE